MYLIKLCEFIDAQMSMMVLGKEQDWIQNDKILACCLSNTIGG
ncbi:MAG: hypothetical protein E7A27_11585 [Erysipelotrichaceae bacterium]|nr:hypothetical protein [Erysipelotrichaceae bacterium]